MSISAEDLEYAALPARDPRGAPTPRRPRRPAADHLTAVVRRLAAENGVDLTFVSGTGKDGRISKRDVLAAASAQRDLPATAATQRDAGPEDRIPAASPQVPQVVSHPVSVVEVDVTRLIELLDHGAGEFTRIEGVPLTLTTVVTKACVEALRTTPALNRRHRDAAPAGAGGSDIALVLADGDAIRRHVLLAAGNLSLAGLARRVAALTRPETSEPLDRSGSEVTFTVTVKHRADTLLDLPAISAQQVAGLAIGAVVRRPMVVRTDSLGETIAIRSMMHVALTYNQFLADHSDASSFLQNLRTRLEEPWSVMQ